MADKNRKRDKIFMDLKQLQYFVVCAQTGSFSDAAKNLYSTQPSVSKVIKGLEDTLGMQLFERLPRGIRLTVQGHKIYEYASKIINEVNVLENMASSGMTKWIRISLNPSSWFANQFVDFYNETYEKKYHFQVFQFCPLFAGIVKLCQPSRIQHYICFIDRFEMHFVF